MEIIDTALHNEIISINKHIDEILKSDNLKMQEIIDWILQSRGKQLRPKLVCLCSKFGNAKADVTKIAAMLEIIHTASLVHDDIVDNSDTRRNYASVWKKYGSHMAVYAGDFMIFCVVKEATADTNNRKYLNLYTVVQKMCYGELGQDSVLYQTNVTEETYISNITGKTATLFQTACELGAMTTKSPKNIISKLGEYGKNLGLLFQIRDDLLDYVSDQAELGKPILQDFVHGIYTLPMIYTFENPSCKEAMLNIVNKVKNEGISNATARQILTIVNDSNGISRTVIKAKEFYDSALLAISDLPEIVEKQCLIALLEKIYNSITLICKKEI